MQLYAMMTGVLPATYTASSNTYSSITNAENVTYTYDSHLWLSEIETESTTYSFSYNVFGQTEGISVGNTEIVSHTYEEQGGKLKSTTYANGTTVSYIYNDRGQLGEVKYTNDGVTTTAYTYLYNEDGTLNRFEDARNGETYLYEYDAAGRLRSYVRYDGDAVINFAGAVTYLANGAVGSTKYSGTYLVGTTTAEMNLSYGYSYNEDGSLATTIIQANSSTGESAFTYDSFGRLTLVETTFEDGVRYPVDFSAEKAYTYLTDTSGNTSALVSTYTTTVGGGTRTYTFTYDVNGNITKIVDSAGYTCRYVYDDLGQLIREDDGYTNHTYLYTYDNAGNIIKKETYNYTGAGIIPVFGGSSVSYGYTNSAWGDQLTSFGGSTITYDVNGNPLQYYNGYNFTWTNGTELATAVNSNYSLSFSYDDNGVRVRKTVNGVDHLYTVNGTQILTERWVADQVEHLLVYLYDASGAPIGMEYRNNTYPESGFDLYLFETNLQGDVIGVYNELGEKIISYTYDAWGNCTMTASANVTAGSDFAAAFNPFRYRSYYYDTELGLYYLNARYYDPNTGRFVSPDPKYISTGQGINSCNMYAYCGNNPINRVDPLGCFWNEVWEFIKAAFAGCGEAVKEMSAAYAVCTGVSVADGPLPFGDVVALVGALVITAGVLCQGIYLATKEQSQSLPKINTYTDISADSKRRDNDAIFPANPNDFNPLGLVKVYREGTYNGDFIFWMDPVTNTEVFRWDENPNKSNGPHYHINGQGHYYAGDEVPELYASIYFPYT